MCRRLRVLSAIVTFGSPVLEVLLSPHYNEGNTLQKESQVAIRLPDDNADALSIILASMQMRSPDENFDLTPGDMVDVAQLCDKYDCAQAIWPVTHAVLDLIGHFATMDDYCNDPAGAGDALAAAAVLKHLTMAWRLGHSLLGHADRTIKCSSKGSALLPILTTNIFGNLE